jgi:hypothetical protein
MARGDNVSIKGYNARIMSTSDGKRQKMTNSVDKNLWIPASAGMTMCVGGNSH